MAKPKLYNLKFCPFGQRAWIALLHHEVDFEYVETDPYNKSPEWLAINPRGLVPAIVYEGNAVYESTVCIEYIDEQWPNSGKPLLPKDPFLRAKVRIWSDHISKKIVPAFYALLLKKSTEERKAAKKDILNAVELLIEAMDEGGPFFLGEEFGMVDIMLVPFAHRTCVTQKYRDFSIPDGGKFQRYKKWWDAVKELPSVKSTLQDEDVLIQRAAKYDKDDAAAGKSQVAKALAAGKALP